ncbi:MAG: hypothetical protein Q8N18_07745 [Opitutaceae bacterium]|nr:hypothetical protein [Opitutaceae bacterium]
METRIALFQKKEIRKTLHAGEWWFVIVDVVAFTANVLAGDVKGGDKLSPSFALKFLTPTEPSKGRGKLPPPFRRPQDREPRKLSRRPGIRQAPGSAPRGLTSA